MLQKTTPPTIEMIVEESKKYKTLKSFKESNPLYYEYGRYYKINDTLYQKPTIELTFEQCYPLVKKYPSRTKLSKGNKKLYDYVSSKQWLDPMLPKGVFGTKLKKYSDEQLMEESKKYTTFKEFRENNQKMYNISYQRGLFTQMSLVKSSTKGNRYVTFQKKSDDQIREELKEYPTKGILKVLNKTLYQQSYSRGILYEVYGGIKHIKYTPVQIMDLLPTFESRKDVYEKNWSLYTQSLKLGLLDLVFPKQNLKKKKKISIS